MVVTASELKRLEGEIVEQIYFGQSRDELHIHIGDYELRIILGNNQLHLQLIDYNETV